MANLPQKKIKHDKKKKGKKKKSIHVPDIKKKYNSCKYFLFFQIHVNIFCSSKYHHHKDPINNYVNRESQRCCFLTI